MSLYKVAGYKKDKDYSEEIKRAASIGDTAGAARFEEARNRKIAGDLIIRKPTTISTWGTNCAREWRTVHPERR